MSARARVSTRERASVMARAARRLAVGAAAAAVAAVALATGGGCAGPPWFLGEPLDGHASITPGSAKLSWVQQRALAERARAGGQAVIEIGALLALDDAARLTRAQQERLVALLWRRAGEFRGRGRAIPESRDLRIVARLASQLPPELNATRAGSERAAGDAWLAVGAFGEAAEAYRQAAALGASETDFRLRAAAGLPPPSGTALGDLEAAVAALPLRAVPLVAGVYMERGGKEPATLARALAAARQEGMTALAGRIEAGMGAGGAEASAEGEGADTDTDTNTTTNATTSTTTTTSTSTSTSTTASLGSSLIPADLDGYLLVGPTISGRLLPLCAEHPKLLDDRLRAQRWVDLMLAEDPTSPDVLELAALLFGRAGRFGGTERMLMELAYYTPERAAGLARGAAAWDRLGRPREACAQWIRAARWRDDPEDPTWRNAVSCTRHDPGAGDWRAIRKYVLERAPAARRDALAASLDAAAEAGAAMGRAP